MYAARVTRAEVHEAPRSTSEALRRALPDGGVFRTVFLGPCPTRTVVRAVRGGVGGGGHAEVLTDATPTQQL